MFASCTVENDMYHEDIAVNMSRAEGVSEGTAGDYALRFWSITIAESWGMSLAGASTVDGYNYGTENLPVTKDGQKVTYPKNNALLYAVGYYPASRLVVSQTNGKDDYQSFTLNTSPEGNKDWLTQPGLVDVCSTDIEQGSAAIPFISSPDNELQFRHTQVKLNFRYKRSVNVNGRIAQIWVTVPQTVIADKWTFSDDGYVPSADPSATGSLIFSSTEDWYLKDPKPEGYDMYYSYFKDDNDKSNYTATSLTDMYVLPSDNLFVSQEGVQCLKFYLDAVIISNDSGISNRRISQYVTIPLREDSDTGEFWTEDVKAGDAFTITVTIEQNRIELWAQRMDWEQGGWITIPLNPNNPDESNVNPTT